MTNVHLHPSDEILMAYADGELDEDVALAVEEAMATEPALIKEVVAFTRSRRFARAVMSNGHEAASDSLALALPASSNERDAVPPKWRWRLFPSWERLGLERPGLVAAVLAIAACGLGYFLGGWSETGPARTAFSHLDDPEVTAVLQMAASGESRSISGGTLDLIATYRLASGTLCRDYVLALGRARAEAVACRLDGKWRTMAAITKPPNDGYTPASGEGVLDGYLQEIKAGEPLSPEDEGRLLSFGE
jgi:hypothetical protein